MTEPLNPNTLLPMSLQVDKMEQTRLLHSAQQHGFLAQQMDTENKEKQNRIDSKEETENVKIEDDNQEQNQKHKREMNEREEGKKDNSKDRNRDGKGLYIDIKI